MDADSISQTRASHILQAVNEMNMMESPVAPKSIEARDDFHVMERCAAYPATEIASNQVIPETRSSLPLKRETDFVEGNQYEKLTSHNDILLRNKINVMESAAHLCTEATADGVFPSGATTTIPFKIDTDRGKGSDSENVASHPGSGNVTNVTKGPAWAAHHATEASSNAVIPCDNNAALPVSLDTHLGEKGIIYEKITSNLQVGKDIDMMESFTSAPYQNTETASNGVISDGDIPAVPFSMSMDLDDLGVGSYCKEEIFECSYCDTFSSRYEDIENHISKEHSEEIRAVHNDRSQDLNSSSLESLPCGTNSSEEETNQTGNGLHITECSAVEQSTEHASNQIIFYDNSLTLPLNKDTDFGVRIKSGEDIFKCAHCDTVSTRRENIESHMSDNHWDEVGAFCSDRCLELNSSPLESGRCKVIISEVTDRVGDETHMMASSAAHQSTQHATTQGFSGGNSSTIPLNKDNDLGIGSNSYEHLFKCAYCDVISKERNEIESHINKEHFQNIDLASKSYALPTNNDTSRGTVNNSDEVTFQCAYCDTLSRSRKEIEIHISEKHCQDTRGARNSDDTNVERVSNSEVVNFKCAYCDKVSNCREEIESHVIEKHTGSHVSNNPNSSSLKCLSCGKVFSSQDDLTRHRSESCTAEARLGGRKQAGWSTHACPLCTKVFNRKDKLSRHLKSCKDQERCPYCSQRFRKRHALIQHVVLSHENEDPRDLVSESFVREASEGCASGKFKCRHCPGEFDAVKSLVQHWVFLHTRRMKAKGPKKKVKCWVCQKEINSKKNLRRHIQSHTGEKTIPCDHCDKYFATKAEQRTHLRFLNLERSFKCEQCGKGFKKQCLLDTHLMRHGNERPFQCPHCDSSFKFSSKLKEHVRIHTGEKPYECRYCDEVFTFIRQRSQHERTKHGVGVKQYNCDQCPKTFKAPNSLNSHRRKHSGNVLRCDKCPFVAAHKINLDMHYVRHTGERPYKCDQCPMQYSQLSRLNIHMRTHSGEKPYSCEQCDKAFVDSYSLKRHKRTHTGEKPYKCSYCDKSFAQGCQRQFHERTHTGEKPYECSQCDKKFSRRQELNKHISTHEKTKKADKGKRKEPLEDSQNERRFTRSQVNQRSAAAHEKAKDAAKEKKKNEAASGDSQRDKRFTRSQENLLTHEKTKQGAKRKRKEPSEDLQRDKRYTRSRELNNQLPTHKDDEQPAEKKLKERKESCQDSLVEGKLSHRQELTQNMTTHERVNPPTNRKLRERKSKHSP